MLATLRINSSEHNTSIIIFVSILQFDLHQFHNITNVIFTLISSILTVMQNVAASLLKGGHAIGVTLPPVEVNSTGTTPNPVMPIKSSSVIDAF